MGHFRAILKFGQFFFWCAVLIPVQITITTFSRRQAAYILPHFFHKRVCRIFQINVETTGAPLEKGQFLYIGNHISYLDISVITAVLPVSFVAKQEVANWPFFGLLAKLQQTAFIDRARHASKKGRTALQDRLKDGKSLVLFPEGTSSDGKTILPFKSTLFSILDKGESDLLVHPFTIELLEVNGHSIQSQQDRDLYAWHGDMTLIPHFWDFARSHGAKVKLHFHTPFRVKESDNRKDLAKLCHNIVAQGLNLKGDQHGYHDDRSNQLTEIPAKKVS
ncbi:MAG: 1-acyl-sn-glycerol-3-phosphate acyltransferase [Alphaproteobacteria bacterium CG_4_9_14_3_um_filter_47_13]|nr:MAG: 1-acyl-sn-glycerol-3-phosphate acyltransferase [Alphaproteobacteria bacterium CG_4_9_14_3_um_filter_47_13]